jgi:hypothetical protein
VVDHRRFDAEYDGPSGEGHMTGETSERFDLGSVKERLMSSQLIGKKTVVGVRVSI